MEGLKPCYLGTIEEEGSGLLEAVVLHEDVGDNTVVEAAFGSGRQLLGKLERGLARAG